VTLTRAGKAALKRLDKRIDAAQEALLAPLSASDRGDLRRLLELLVERGLNASPAQTRTSTAGYVQRADRRIGSPLGSGGERLAGARGDLAARPAACDSAGATADALLAAAWDEFEACARTGSAPASLSLASKAMARLSDPV
jgi:hypothetical protein